MAEPKSTKPVRLEHLERMNEYADHYPKQPNTTTTLRGMERKRKTVEMVALPFDGHSVSQEKSGDDGILPGNIQWKKPETYRIHDVPVLIPQVRQALKYPISLWEMIHPPGGDNAVCM
jgi:hypothetical protein